jgi:tRNA pseudouridine38-40 synthase
MIERNIKMILEYDGTDFHGWQSQEGLRTVQGVVEAALDKVMTGISGGRKTAVIAAGRTDAGVHATGQVCSFMCSNNLAVQRLKHAASSHLPKDVCIRGLEEAPLAFNARFSAVARRYSFFVRTEPTALWRRFVHVIRYVPDVGAMRRALQYLLGEKDFASFAVFGKEPKPSQCWIRRVDIQECGSVIGFHIEADHFLHKMVRTMVGTLLEVGRGRISPEQIEDIICKKDRAAAGPTLPPHGLFLVEVVYDS